MLRYHTAGESHGKALLALIEGFPAGVHVSGRIDRRRIAPSPGRVRARRSAAARVRSCRDHKRPVARQNNRQSHRTVDSQQRRQYRRVGRAGLPSAGTRRLGRGDQVPWVDSRHAGASEARETAARVAAGALAGQLLTPLGIAVFGYVVELGPINIDSQPGTLAQQRTLRDQSELYTLNPDQDQQIKTLIEKTGGRGDTLGGVVEVRVEGAPFGLGSHAQWDGKLDGSLAQAVMSVQAVKGVEIGLGFTAARRLGSETHDPIRYDPALAATHSLGFTRPTNNAGGLEAGMSNSQPIVLRAACKPINTLASPLESVNLAAKGPKRPRTSAATCAQCRQRVASSRMWSPSRLPGP